MDSARIVTIRRDTITVLERPSLKQLASVHIDTVPYDTVRSAVIRGGKKDQIPNIMVDLTLVRGYLCGVLVRCHCV